MIDLENLSVSPFPLTADDAEIASAKEFALQKWQERHDERKADWERVMNGPYSRQRPVDLSSSCKMTSIFAAVVFGGEIRGNIDHQFAMVGSRIIDLNEDAADVVGVSGVHRHDRRFFGNPDHVESMESCLPRVRQWLDEYANACRLRMGSEVNDEISPAAKP